MEKGKEPDENGSVSGIKGAMVPGAGWQEWHMSRPCAEWQEVASEARTEQGDMMYCMWERA